MNIAATGGARRGLACRDSGGSTQNENLPCAVSAPCATLSPLCEKSRPFMPSPNPPSRVASVHLTSTSPRPRETGNYSSRCAENDLRAGQKAFGADRYHEALFYFDRATSGDEANPEAWYRKGNCLHVLKRNLEAARCYDRALELDPTRTAAWNNKGIVLTGLGTNRERYPLLRSRAGDRSGRCDGMV